MERRAVLAWCALPPLAGCLDTTSDGDPDGQETDNATADDETGRSNATTDDAETDTDTGETAGDADEGTREETAETDHETAERVIDPDELSGFVQPDDEPTTVPSELHCDDENFERFKSYEQFEAGDGIEYGDDGSFALRVADVEYEYGDEAQFTLTNITSSEQPTGNKYKYSLEIETENGWEEIRGTEPDSPYAYADEPVIMNDTGTVFEWSIELTEDGVIDAANWSELTELVDVCPDLTAGRYRFVYWGLDTALAVEFDLER